MSKDDEVALTRTAAAQKGHFTRAMHQIEATLEEIRANPTSAGKEILEKLNKAHDRVIEAYNAVIKYVPGSSEQADKTCEEIAKMKADITQYATRAMIECVNTGRDMPRNNQNPFQGMRVVQALSPDTLTKDSTPSELRLWIEAYRAYFLASKMDKITVEEQQAFWYRCLDNSLETTLRQRIDTKLRIFGNNSCMSQLDNLSFFYFEALDTFP